MDVKTLISEEPGTVWTNERSLEFLERYREEPCLWDCRLPEYKIRVVQGDAWRRLVGALSWSPTLYDLKKRRDSLMGYYRMHVHKYKEARATGRQYRTSWFAFRSMHDFLAPIYAGDSPPGSEMDTPDGEGSQSPPAPLTTTSRTLKRSPSDHHEETPSSPQFVPLPGPCKMERSDSQFDQVSGQTRYDEFDHFGLMIASKVRRIEDFEERETVMNVIQNIVYQSVMKSRPADLPP